MASVRGLTPEAIKALIEDSKRDYKVVRESLTTMYRRYEGLDSDLDHLSRRMDSLPDELKGSLDSLVDLDEVLAAAREEVDSLRQRLPIQSVDIADDAITANKIEAGAITALQIAAGAVTTEKLAAGAVVAKKIDAEAVTADKLAADSVTAGSIAADSVLTRHIGTEQVTAEKLKAGSVEAEKIAAGAVTSNSIAAGSITADNIEAGAFQLRPNSILPDSAFGNFPPKNSTATAENPMPGLSKDVHGYRDETLGGEYIPFSRPVEISTNGRYSLDMDVYLDSTKKQLNYVAIILVVEGINDEGVVIKATGTIDGEDDTGYAGAEVFRTSPSLDLPSDIPVDTNVIVLTMTPGSDYKYDHTNIKIEFELVAPGGSTTLKVHGFMPSVRGVFTRFDILAHAPTMKDLEDAQRATHMFAEDLSAAMGQLSTNLTATARELSAIRQEFSTSTSTSFMLVWPDISRKNDVSIMSGYAGDLIDKFVLHNDSNRPVAYTSTVSVSQTNSGQSDVVRSGIAAPKSHVDIGPYNKRTPASVLVEPMAVESVVIEDFDIEFTESDRDIVNGKPDPNSLRKRILMVPSKDIQAVALEVIEGVWGNDPERTNRLREAGYDPEVIQRVVNGIIPQNNKFEDRPDYYQRLTFSADVVVPQVGSWFAATTVEVYLVQWTKYKGYNSVFKRVVEQSQRAGSFGTHRTNVSYNLNYDGPFPSAGLPSDWDVTTKLEREYDQFQLVVHANNGNGKIIGTIASGGITLY